MLCWCWNGMLLSKKESVLYTLYPGLEEKKSAFPAPAVAVVALVLFVVVQTHTHKEKRIYTIKTKYYTIQSLSHLTFHMVAVVIKKLTLTTERKLAKKKFAGESVYYSQPHHHIRHIAAATYNFHLYFVHLKTCFVHFNSADYFSGPGLFRGILVIIFFVVALHLFIHKTLILVAFLILIKKILSERAMQKTFCPGQNNWLSNISLFYWRKYTSN